MLKSKLVLFVLFVVSNFGALGIGTLLMNNGSKSTWYYQLNKAPWTPDGWVFGAAWFSLMTCFSIYLTQLSFKLERPNIELVKLYAIQWILNVSWNYIFFNKHLTVLGLVIIIMLWLLIGYITFKYLTEMKYATVFILPYLVWMTIATSLNAYIVINN
jgi:tryptophan-rich sensory protein